MFAHFASWILSGKTVPANRFNDEIATKKAKVCRNFTCARAAVCYNQVTVFCVSIESFFKMKASLGEKQACGNNSNFKTLRGNNHPCVKPSPYLPRYLRRCCSFPAARPRLRPQQPSERVTSSLFRSTMQSSKAMPQTSLPSGLRTQTVCSSRPCLQPNLPRTAATKSARTRFRSGWNEPPLQARPRQTLPPVQRRNPARCAISGI